MARGEKSRLDWDRHNTGHIAKHKVTPEEVEQARSNDPLFIETQIDPISGEERVRELGHTNTGRVLAIVWTPRGDRVRAVTAFPVKKAVRAAYYKRRSDEQT